MAYKGYRSQAQRDFFHSAEAKKAGITPEMVAEMDKATGNRKLPARRHKK